MTTKGNELQLPPSTTVQLNDFFFCIKKTIPPAAVLNIVMAEVKKKCLGLALHCGNGEGEISDDSTWATCFHPLLTPACFSGASSPARPATPLVPCSSTTPPPPPPRPPSRPKLPPGKPGVGDVVCSLLPWLTQKLIVHVTNRSEKNLPTGHLHFGSKLQVTCRNGPDRWHLKGIRCKYGYPSQPSSNSAIFKAGSKMGGKGTLGLQFCYSGFDADQDSHVQLCEIFRKGVVSFHHICLFSKDPERASPAFCL